MCSRPDVSMHPDWFASPGCYTGWLTEPSLDCGAGTDVVVSTWRWEAEALRGEVTTAQGHTALSGTKLDLLSAGHSVRRGRREAWSFRMDPLSPLWGRPLCLPLLSSPHLSALTSVSVGEACRPPGASLPCLERGSYLRVSLPPRTQAAHLQQGV